MAAESVGVGPCPTAAVRPGLPPGATVADLVAALAARRARPVTDPTREANHHGEPGDRRPACPRPGEAELDRSRLPAPRRPVDGPPGPELVVFTHPRRAQHEHADDHRPDRAAPRSARPPIGDDLSLFGLSRRSRSRVGSRLFTLFFALVFGSIAVQMVYSILYP